MNHQVKLELSFTEAIAVGGLLGGVRLGADLSQLLDDEATKALLWQVFEKVSNGIDEVVAEYDRRAFAEIIGNYEGESWARD